MEALLTKEQLTKYTGISGNIFDDVFNTGVLVVTDTQIAQYISEQCVADILAIDPDDYQTVDDLRPELSAFYFNYVVNYIAWSVYAHCVNIHGLNWTNQGIVKFGDSANTSAAISDNERQTLINNALRIRNTYLTKMRVRFRDVNETFDGITYEINKEKYDTKEAEQNNSFRVSPMSKLKTTYKTRL